MACSGVNVIMEPATTSSAEETEATRIDEEVHGDQKLGFFGKWLTLWVALCMIIGTAIGSTWPGTWQIVRIFFRGT